MGDEVNLTSSGQNRQPARTPKAISAESESRNSFAKIVFGGAILCILTVAYVVAVIMKVDGTSPQQLVIIVSGGIGYLLGNRDAKQSE